MKPSIMNETNVHESMDTILQDVQRTILQTNEIERFAVFSREKTIRPRNISPLSFISRQSHGAGGRS
nr:hypothetical protein P5627_01100 [Bacillus safensis]